MKKRSKFGTLFKMLGLVKPLSGFMCLAVLTGTLGYLAVQFIPILGGFAVLHGLKFDTPIGITAIWVCLVLFALLRAVLRYTEQRTNHYIAFTLLAIIRDKVFKALRKLCPAKLEGRDKGDLISLITSDVELLEVFYAHTISPICIAFLVELVMVIFISSYHWSLGLLALCAFVSVGVILPLIISKRSGNTGDEIRSQSGELAAYVLENIRGLDETVQYGNGMQRMDGMNRKTQQLTENQGNLNKLTGFNLALANTFILVFDIAMLLLSAHLYSKGITDPEKFRALFGKDYNGYGWMGPKMRWCTNRLKDQPREQFLRSLREKYDIRQYVGIAADEQYRLERKNNQRSEYIHPLVEWNMTEADCLQYCKERGFDWNGLYDRFKRVSCWLCPLQSL